MHVAIEAASPVVALEGTDDDGKSDIDRVGYAVLVCLRRQP